MKHIFVDTSGWDALADKADKDHAKALQFRDEIAGNCKLVTSIDFQIINFTRPEGGRRISYTSATDNTEVDPKSRTIFF